MLNYRCQRGVKRNSDTQMRMLYVLRTLDPEWGGPVEGVRRMSQALIALTNGATSIEIACSDSPNATWHSDWNSPVHALGAGKFGMYGYNAALARWLKSEVKRFDVVVVSGIWMYRSFATSAAAAQRNRGLGLVSMQERVYLVHGTLSVESQPGKGTKILAVVPLVAENGNSSMDRMGEDAGQVKVASKDDRLLATTR